MNKQAILGGILTVVLCVCLSGCNQVSDVLTADKNKFVGTWHNATTVPASLDFSSDGACSISGVTGTWELQDGKLAIEILDSNVTITYSYLFSNNDRTLALTLTTGGQTIIYTKE